MKPSDCAFDYRDSVFKHDARLVVTRAALRLRTISAPNLTYRDLKTHFDGQAPHLSEIRDAVIAIRSAKFPDLSREGSAGSYFKNLILPAEKAEELKKQYPDMPLFPMPETTGVKVPIAWLLDHVLHLNGFHMGTARVFEGQPIVLVADRGAYARDVQALAAYVRERVRETLGIEMEEEVKIISNLKSQT
jgi:UDP-N-acetylmuramate dehydrogenase